MDPVQDTFFAWHPLQLFSVQIFLNTIIIGFSSPRSFFRPAVLPLTIICAYGIISTSKEYIRPHWASLLSGSSVGFVLQYLDSALLTKRSFRFRKDDVLGLQDGQTKATKGEQKPEGSIVERLYFGLISTFSFRNLNTPYEVKNVRQFPNGNIPSRARFVLWQIFVTIVCILVIDVSSAQPPPPNPRELFSEDKVPFLTRLGDITSEELVLRVLSTIIYWVNMYAIMQGVTSASATIAVGLGLSKVEAWRPFFGSPAEAYDLRGFWGKYWHQMLRQVLSSPASFVTHNIFLQKKGTLSARYLKLGLTFAISGWLHMFAELGGGLPLEHSGTMRFFCTQVYGIIIEDAIKALFSAKKQKESKRPSLGLRLFGYVWVVSFLVWSTPAWLYPVAARPSEGSFLPFSIVKRFINN